MKTQIYRLGIWITKKNPCLKPIMEKFNKLFLSDYFQKPPEFSGWGMTTQHTSAWNDEYSCDTFCQTCVDLEMFDFTPSVGFTKESIEEHKWRHYFISFSVLYAIKFAQIKNFNFVECGVGDGVSALFALTEISNKLKNNFKMHLYDGWTSMNKNYLLDSESDNEGRYYDLSIDRTKHNLIKFEQNTIFHQGSIPDTFTRSSPPPESIVYLHIDLNSSEPTLAALDFFFPKLVHGGIIIFDDYGWDGYPETKLVIDKFFSDKRGILLKSPTGQAIYFHNCIS